MRVESDQFLVTAKHPAAAMTAVVGASTPDDQSRTWDGRVLNSREAVLEFLAEIEEARRRGFVQLDQDDPAARGLLSAVA